MTDPKWLLPALGLAIAACATVITLRASRSSNAIPPPSPENPMSNVIHLSSPAFPAVKAQGKPVLIDFWAPWCGPCRAQGPILETVSAQLGEQAIVAKVNVDDERGLAQQFGVEAIPTLVIMKDGKIVKRYVGVQQATGLVAALQAAQR